MEKKNYNKVINKNEVKIMSRYENEVKNDLFGFGDENKAFAKYFINKSYLLLVTAGSGWYQEEGKPAQSLEAGDVVAIHEGIKHWHGAKKDSWFSHIAITKGTSEWLEPVDDDHYLALD